MKRYILKSLEVIKGEGLVPFFKKTYINLKIIILRSISGNSHKENDEWLKLKGKYKGERAFLIGNGGSLNQTPLYLLKNEYTMCFNRFNLFWERLSWKPKFYICDDDIVAKDCSDEINQKIVPQVQQAFFPDYHKSGVSFKKFVNKRDNVLWFHQDFIDFSFDLPKVGSGGTVAYTGLQILLYLGFSEVYIIGMDMDYKIHETATLIKGIEIESNDNDDPNHFDPRYFGKGKKYHQPVAGVMTHIFESLALANEKYKNSSTRLFNATLGGVVECFPRIDFYSLFTKLGNSEKAELFLLGFPEKIKTLQELNKEYKYLDEYDNEKMNFSISSESAKILMPKIIYTHIPFGPFDGKYYFKYRGDADEAL
jgi:hypothetical protein